MWLSNLLQGMNVVENAIDKAVPKVSFETFMESVGDTIDSEIRNSIAKGLTFLGGKAHFSTTPSDKVKIEVNIFYMKEDGTYSKYENTGEYPLYFLKEEAQQELYELMEETGEYVVEIQKP